MEPAIRHKSPATSGLLPRHDPYRRRLGKDESRCHPCLGKSLTILIWLRLCCPRMTSSYNKLSINQAHVLFRMVSIPKMLLSGGDALTDSRNIRFILSTSCPTYRDYVRRYGDFRGLKSLPILGSLGKSAQVHKQIKSCPQTATGIDSLCPLLFYSSVNPLTDCVNILESFLNQSFLFASNLSHWLC